MSITFHKPDALQELLQAIDKIEDNFYLLAGGTDINVQLKSGLIETGTIFYINHLEELKGIEEQNGTISIGANTTIDELLHSTLINRHLPYIQTSLVHFASPLIQSTATIGGNIANGSPTGDLSPPLLVLDAKLELLSVTGSRTIPLTNFYKGYKKFEMKPNEIISKITVNIQAQSGFTTFFHKVGARNALAISKLSIAGLKKLDNNRIEEIKLATGSLNECPRRLTLLEEYLTGRELNDISKYRIEKILKQEITPISDLRSDKDYRFRVCLNLVEGFVSI